MGDRLGAMNERGGSGIAKPSGLRAPGGFGFQGGAPGMNRSTSGGKSRLLSNMKEWVVGEVRSRMSVHCTQPRSLGSWEAFGYRS